MLEKFLREIVSLVAGTSADKIVEVMFKKYNVNEFLIAKKLNLTINQARNILYKLADDGLVYFTRKKDLKSGGWYTYFWTLDDYKCLVYYRGRLLKEIEQHEHELLNKRTKQFYFCKICGMEVTEEAALLHDFTCPECGEVFSMKDSVENIKEIEKTIQKLRDKAAQVQIVIDEVAASRIPKIKKKEAVKKNIKKKPAAKKAAGKKKKAPMKKSRTKKRKR